MIEGLPVDGLILAAGGLLLVGVMLVGVSERLRVPAALLSLAVGMLFGSDALGLVDVADFELVRNVSVIALVIILFEGGLTTKPSAIREAGLPGFALSTVGVLITAAVTALGVELLFGRAGRPPFSSGRWWPRRTPPWSSTWYVGPRCLGGWPRSWRWSRGRTTRWRSC